MTPEEFASTVRSEASGDLPPSWLDLSIQLFVDLGLTESPGARQQCRQHAQRAYMLHLAEQQQGQHPAQPQAPLTPGIQAVSESRAKAIAPEVAAIRRAVLGDDAVPFASYDDAVAWIKRTAKKPVPSELAQRLETLRQEIQTRCREWAELTQGASGWTWSQQLIAYSEPEATVLSFVGVPAGSQPLAVLAHEAQRLAQLTGFPPYSIIAYILADVQPALGPVTLSWNMSMNEALGIFREQATLTLNTPDLTYEDRRRMQRAIRAQWDVARAKRLTPSDERFLDLVTQCGEGPRKGKGCAAFWRKVQQAWNDTASSDGKRHETWRATQTLHNRLHAKLQRITAQLTLRGALCGSESA